MTTSALGASFDFGNLQGLTELRREAAADAPAAKVATAQQFEALFLNLMLKQMRAATTVDGGLFDGPQMEQYQSMLDQQLALSLSQSGGVGLTPSILRALGGAPGAARPTAAQATVVQLPAAQPMSVQPRGGDSAGSLRSALPRVSAAPSSSASGPSAAVAPMPAAESAAAANGAAEAAPATPEQFVAALWPYAEKAARALGCPPQAIVAQAALETGWGRAPIRDEQGRPTFNLFGIKADANWQGPRTRVSTLEFVGGVPERRSEPFRAYPNVGAAVDDYVAFVKGHPRYADALGASTAADYAKALQAAGYATDPHYARKIVAIVNRGLPGRPDQAAGATADTSLENGPGALGADGGRT